MLALSYRPGVQRNLSFLQTFEKLSEGLPLQSSIALKKEFRHKKPKSWSIPHRLPHLGWEKCRGDLTKIFKGEMSGDHVQPTLGLCMSFKNCSQLIRSLWLTSAKDSRQTPVEMGEVAALDMASAKTSKRSFWFVWRFGTPKTCCL